MQWLHGHYRRVRPHSAESIEKNAAARRGAKRSDAFRARMRAVKTGRALSAEHAQRIGAKHRGMKRSPETAANISKALTGKKLSQEHCDAIGRARRGKPLLKNRGENHYAWKGGGDRDRDNPEYHAWARAVKRRDDYRCKQCGHEAKRGMHAHHVKPWVNFPDLRYDVANGETLCGPCHRKHHVTRPSRNRATSSECSTSA